MTRDRRSGVSLLNVLAVLAVGTGLVHVMLRDQNVALTRLELTNNAAQAHSLAQSGVASVAVALRRDFRLAPDTDHLAEEWAQSAQNRIALDFGQFEVSIRDARGRFDLNALDPAALGERRVFDALLAVLDLPGILANQITQIIAQNGPLDRPEDLGRFGIAEGDIKRLSPHVVTVSTRGSLNLNTVTEPLMIALTRNPSAARALIARRSAKGFLERSDLAAFGVQVPPLSGFTSDVFDITVTADIAEARALLARRLFRDTDTGAVKHQPLP